MMEETRDGLIALLRGERVPSPLAPQAQAHAVRHGSTVCRIERFAVLRVSGEDAPAFLQGQLSNDVRALDGRLAQYSSYSTPKGRVMASFLLWRQAEAFFLLLSADIAAAIARRLSMFVLRSKVRIEPVSDGRLFGFHGPLAEQWLEAARPGLIPAGRLETGGDGDGLMTVRLPSGALLLWATPAAADTLAGAGSAALQCVDDAAWGLLDIDAGIPWVSLPTQEQFVPQMLNMDIFGALSFTKGCYPGQEIIARARYLGQVKRRMYRVELPVEAAIGTPLFSPETADQTIGMVVNVACDDSGRMLALIVAHSGAWEQGVYLDRDFQQKLVNLSLPYALSDE